MRRVQLCDPSQEVDTALPPAPPAPPTIVETLQRLPRRPEAQNHAPRDVLDQMLQAGLVSRSTILSQLLGDMGQEHTPLPTPSDL